MSSALLAPVSSGLVSSGAAAAAPMTGGMSLLLPLLMSFGPSVLSKLFGGKDRNQLLREQIEKLLSPGNINQTTNALYRQAVSSPAYSAALSGIATGANQTANNVAANLAERGIGTTGTGAVLSGLTPSLVGSQSGRLQAMAYDTAHKTALDSIMSRIAALQGTSGPSRTEQMFATGLESFQPYLQAWLKQKYPSLNFSTSGAR